MEHEAFPVKGFEFMDEPATDVQKLRIVAICAEMHIEVDVHGQWPDPFSKWDAYNTICALEEQLAEYRKGAPIENVKIEVID